MNILLIIMILTLLIPIYEGWQNQNVWEKILAISSFSSKAAILILFISVVRDDWMIGIVGVIILTVGNAGLMLLSQVIKRVTDETINN